MLNDRSIVRKWIQNTARRFGYDIRRRPSALARTADLLPEEEFLSGFVACRLRNFDTVACVDAGSHVDLVAEALGSGTRFAGIFTDRPASSTSGNANVDTEGSGGTRPMAELAELPPGSLVVLPIANSTVEMSKQAQLREHIQQPTMNVGELTRGYYLFSDVYSNFAHYRPLADIASYFLGRTAYGDAGLYSTVPLSGRSVLELGPLDGSMSACILQQNPRSLTVVDSHWENFLKLRTAEEAFCLENLSVVLDDFHNVTRRKYGKVDVLYAHGVIYHSEEPFLLLEQLSEMTDSLIVGTHCVPEQSVPEQSVPKSRVPEGSRVYKWRGKEWPAEQETESPESVGGPGRVTTFFSVSQYREMFSMLGFEVKDILLRPLANGKQDFFQFAALRRPA